MAIGEVYLPAPPPQPTLGSGPVGGSINLGAAYVPEEEPPRPVAPAAPAMGGMGQAAAAAFPTLAAIPVDTERAGQRIAPRQEPEAPAAPARPLSALEQATLGNQTTSDVLSQYLAENPVQVVTSRNPVRPLVEQQAQFQQGGGQLDAAPFEFVPPQIPRNEGETDEEYADRVQTFAAASYQGQLESYGRNVAEQQAKAQQLGDVRDIGKPGHLGMGEAKLQAAERLGDAQIEQQLAVTVARQQAAESQRAAIEAARAADAERREFARTQRDAITQLQQTEKAARAKVESLPELDPQRFFKSQMGAQKFWTILGAALGGWAGHDVASNLRAEAEADLEAQKANASQAFAQLDAAEGAVQESSTLYQDLLRGAGDEAIADSMWIKLQMEDAATSLEEVLAKTTEPVLRAQLDADLVNLRGQIEAEDQKINYALATTPHTVSTAYDPIGRRQRKRIEERIDKLDERGFKLAETGIEREGKGIERQAQMDLELEKQERQNLRGEGGVYREAADLADKIAGPQAILMEIQDLRKDFADGIPGVGAFMGTETAAEWISGVAGGENRAHQFKKRVENLVEKSLREATGAAAADHEVEKYVNLIMEGAGDINGEAKVWANLDAFSRNIENQIDVRTRGRSPEAVEYLTRNKVLPDRDPMKTIGREPERDVVRRK